jgi:hypothetical protein
MSGTGKSTVLTEPIRRGQRVIDTDDPGWIVETHSAGGAEPVWDLDQIMALIDRHGTRWLFVAGCVANQGAVYDHFDALVRLSARVDVILDRLADRGNHLGSTAEARMKDHPRSGGVREPVACRRRLREPDHHARRRRRRGARTDREQYWSSSSSVARAADDRPVQAHTQRSTHADPAPPLNRLPINVALRTPPGDASNGYRLARGSGSQRSLPLVVLSASSFAIVSFAFLARPLNLALAGRTTWE